MTAPDSLAPPTDVRRNLKAARSFLLDHTTSQSGRLYHVYFVLICALFLGAPGIASAIGVVSSLGVTHGTAAVLEVLHKGGSVLMFLVAFVPSYAGLVVAGAQELFFFVAGPFGVRRTLTNRTLTLCGAFIVGGVAVAGVVVAGLDLGASSVTVRTLASGVGFGGMIAGALVLGQSRWRFGSRWLFAALGLTLWFFSPVFAASASSAVVVAVGELTIGVVLSALTPVILDHVSIAQLEADHASRQVVTAGLLVGDSRAFASAQTRKRYFRRVHLPIPKGWWGRILWVDWLSVIRSPIRLAGAGAVGVATGVVVSTTGGDVLVIAVALVVLQRVFRVFAQGLSDYLDTIGADGITPDLFWGRVFRHSTLPWVGYIFFLCLGFVTAILTLPDVALDPWVCAVVLCVPPCVTVMLAGESGVPVSMLTPVATPLGDASILVLVGWMVRGFIPAGLFLVVGTIAGGLAATVMLIPVTVVSALLRLRRLAGI